MTGQENIAEADVQHWLRSVGVESLCQLEVLAFFCRHRFTLLPAQYLARLLGYQIEPVVVALNSLAARQLLEWSPQSQGTRVYEFIAPSVQSRSDALERLLALSAHRQGRLLLGKHLGPGNETSREERRAARRQFRDAANADLETIRRFCGRTSDTVQ